MKEINNESEFAIEMVGIKKSFGAVDALKGVDFKLKKGEVLGLLGDNGAGKSTMINIISGVFKQDKGEMYINGKLKSWDSPQQARDAGIETVYQHLNLIGLMSIARVFFLGKEPRKKNIPAKWLGILDQKYMNSEADKSLEELEIKGRDPKEIVRNLSGGERQAIAIGRALYFGANILLLDEPTAALSVRETEKVLNIIADLKNRNISVIFISHNIYQAHSVADRVTVIDRGTKICDVNTKDYKAEEIMKIVSTGKFSQKANK